MAVFTAGILSGSTNGRPVKVAATAIGSGTTIHTATSVSGAFDEVSIYVTNTHTATVSVTLGWGGTTDPDDLICKTVSLSPLSGPVPIVTGLRLNGGVIVKAAGSTANVLLVTGIVNSISP